MRNIKREIDSVCHKKLYSLITDNSFSDNYHFKPFNRNLEMLD